MSESTGSSSLSVLFLADTDRTQAYVFESTRLPEIRGASRILEDANREAGKRVEEAGGRVLVRTGGMLVALLDTETQAKALKDQIERLYADLSGGIATTTVAWRSLPPGWQKRPFGEVLAWATLWLDREKRGKPHAPWVAAPPHAERCRSCGLRPASPEASYADWPLCTLCRHKITYQGRWGWFETFAQWLQSEPGKPYRPKWRALLERSEEGPRAWPQDIHELAQVSSGRRDTFALLYLDGDGIGQIFRRAQTPNDVHHLSTTLYAALREAVFHALATHLEPTSVEPGESRRQMGEGLGQKDGDASNPITIYPFEILTIGGDDVWLLVPTHAALDVALSIMRGFQESMASTAPGLSLSGGVVFAEEHVPIPRLLDMARELAASAKAVRRETQAREGYLDFWVVTTDLPDRDLRRLRRLFPYRLTGDPALPDDAVTRLSGRPYALSVWQKALAALQRLRLPRAQLQRLVEMLPQGVEPLRAYYHYQRARTRTEIWSHLDAVLRAFAHLSQAPEPLAYPWFNYQKPIAMQIWTPLVDVLELAPFVVPLHDEVEGEA